MTTRELLIQEIDQAPEDLLQILLHYQKHLSELESKVNKMLVQCSISYANLG